MRLNRIAGAYQKSRYAFRREWVSPGNQRFQGCTFPTNTILVLWETALKRFFAYEKFSYSAGGNKMRLNAAKKLDFRFINSLRRCG